MNGKEYQNLAMRTNDGNATNRLLNLTLSDTTENGIGEDTGVILNACLGLSGEVGEFNDMIKKWIFQGHKLDTEHLAKELGDIAWYLAISADAIGYDLETIIRMNVEKLRARYPDGFDSERSIHRSENDI